MATLIHIYSTMAMYIMCAIKVKCLQAYILTAKLGALCIQHGIIRDKSQKVNQTTGKDTSLQER